MNKTYALVWNSGQGVWQVAGERARRRGKASTRTRRMLAVACVAGGDERRACVAGRRERRVRKCRHPALRQRPADVDQPAQRQAADRMVVVQRRCGAACQVQPAVRVVDRAEPGHGAARQRD
ncbi:ESPR domain-containing protein [Burkholderia cepacia]|nr:ESPR domain-containing protein [Burkholderia cepacia]UQP11266.1 ESPR domain-containing protein [Burkholderia cepacia]